MNWKNLATILTYFGIFCFGFACATYVERKMTHARTSETYTVSNTEAASSVSLVCVQELVFAVTDKGGITQVWEPSSNHRMTCK